MKKISCSRHGYSDSPAAFGELTMELTSTLQPVFQTVLEQIPFRNCEPWRENHTGVALVIELWTMEELCWSRLFLKDTEKIHAGT